MKAIRLLCRLSLLSSFSILAMSTSADAAAFAPATGGITIFSAAVGIGGASIGATAQVRGSRAAQGVTIGSAIWLIGDPEFATFFDGQISFDFDSNSLEVTDFGWLGDWGIDPSLEAPPVLGGRFISEDISFTPQLPNSDLSTNVILDNVNGNITVSYDWGASGYQSPADVKNFNFFAIEFTTKSELSELREFYNIANYSATGNFNNCIPPGEEEIRKCGQPVPEPSFLFSLLSLGIIGVGAKIILPKLTD